MSLRTEKNVFSGFFIDSLLSIPMGTQFAYFDDGAIQNKRMFDMGRKIGTWLTWDSQGHLLDSSFYENDSCIYKYIQRFDESGILKYASLSDGQYRKKFEMTYYDDGKMKSESQYEGIAVEKKSYFPSGKISAHTRHDETGKEVSAQFFDEEGTIISKKVYLDNWMKERDAEEAKRPAYRNELLPFYMNNIKIPKSLKQPYGKGLDITFSYMLDENGIPFDIKLISPQNQELEASILKMFKKMKPWNMKGLKQYGPVTETVMMFY